MKIQRMLPLMAAALVAGACTGEPGSPTAADARSLAAPAGPRMDGSQMDGGGGLTSGETTYDPTATATTEPVDSTALTGRGGQMGGSGG